MLSLMRIATRGLSGVVPLAVLACSASAARGASEPATETSTFRAPEGQAASAHDTASDRIDQSVAAPSGSPAERAQANGAPAAPRAIMSGSGAPAQAEPGWTADGQDAQGAPQQNPAELPRGTTILHIGDSFAGALGIDLNRELKERGVRGILKYQTSTYIPTWAHTKDLDKYLWQFHPDLVLITLGANELEIPDPHDRIPTIQRLVKRLGGRPCVWVGPPLWEGARPALVDTIRESCAPCAFLDSTALVPNLERNRDGIHPSMEARKIWAKAVLAWLTEHRAGTSETPWQVRQ